MAAPLAICTESVRQIIAIDGINLAGVVVPAAQVADGAKSVGLIVGVPLIVLGWDQAATNLAIRGILVNYPIWAVNLRIIRCYDITINVSIFAAVLL